VVVVAVATEAVAVEAVTEAVVEAGDKHSMRKNK